MVRNGRQEGEGRGGEGGKGRGHGGRHSKTAPPPGCKWPTKSRPAILWGVWMASKGRATLQISCPNFVWCFLRPTRLSGVPHVHQKKGVDMIFLAFHSHYKHSHSIHTTHVCHSIHTTHISHSIHTTHISHSKIFAIFLLGGGGGDGLENTMAPKQTLGNTSSARQEKLPRMNSKCKCEKIMGFSKNFTTHDKNWVIENCPYQRVKKVKCASVQISSE